MESLSVVVLAAAEAAVLDLVIRGGGFEVDEIEEVGC